VAAALSASTGWLWLHLNMADQRCWRWLTQQVQVPPGIVSDVLEDSKRQYLNQSSDIVYGQINDFRQVFGEESTEQAYLNFFATPRILVTARVKPVQSAESLRRDLARGIIVGTPYDLLGLLITNYPDTLDMRHSQLMDELEAIEDHVLSDRHRGERQRLMIARREIAYLHRHMRSLRRALVMAERTVDNSSRVMAQVVVRLGHLDQDFDMMEQRARFFHDEIDAKLAAETNRQLYRLSVITAAFLPPTLVAGLFGMNVKGIPWSESDFGFVLALVTGLLSSALVGLWLWNSNRD
jgi:zinc transporter